MNSVKNDHQKLQQKLINDVLLPLKQSLDAARKLVAFSEDWTATEGILGSYTEIQYMILEFAKHQLGMRNPIDPTAEGEK